MLTAARKTEIENLVSDILKKYNVVECPAKSMHNIMDKEGILYFEDSIDDVNFDGLLTKNKDGKFCIYINTLINYIPRHNFTIAHELGHFFLGHELQDGSIICDRINISEENSIDSIIIEQEANYFATCFLMPSDMFLMSYKKIMKKLDREYYQTMYVDNQACNYTDWKKMFCYFYYDFRISILALKYRLESFNLIQFNWDSDTWLKTVKDYIDVSYTKN